MANGGKARIAVRMMEQYFLWYGELGLQRRMVRDRRRTDGYARAIAELVTPGDVVVDVGTGTGLLAMLAANAGARVVYAVDQSDIAQAAVDLTRANGLDKKIKVFHGAAADLQVDEPPDLIVSEWMGHLAFVEDMLADVLLVRDRLLKPGGRMLPSGIELLLAPMDDPVLFAHDGPGFWRNPVHGIDFSSLETLELQQARSDQLLIEPGSLLSPAKPIVALDLCVAGPTDPWTHGEVEFEVRRDGALNGFAAWFVAQLSKGVALDTGPYCPATHWSQTYLPFMPRIVTRGSRLSVSYRLRPHPDDHRHVELTLRVGDDEQRFLVD